MFCFRLFFKKNFLIIIFTLASFKILLLVTLFDIQRELKKLLEFNTVLIVI